MVKSYPMLFTPPEAEQLQKLPHPHPLTHQETVCNFSEMLNQSWTNHEESNNRVMKV